MVRIANSHPNPKRERGRTANQLLPRSRFGLGIVFASCLLCFCAPAHAQKSGKVVIASKAFPESRLLAEVMAQLIEAKTDLNVERKYGLGGTMICFSAIKSGEVDIYPEYTGTALLSILKSEPGEDRSSDTIFNQVKTEFSKQHDLEWMGRFGFNNGYALAARPELGVEKISDLKAIQDTLKVRFQHEFLARADGYPAIKERYGISFKDVAGMEHGLAYRALDDDKIDLMDAYTTDGPLNKIKVKLLEDDLQLFPPYDAAPVVRRETLDRFPQLREVLMSLEGKIPQQEMIAMNDQITSKEKQNPVMASEFLVSQGLLAESEAVKWTWKDDALSLLRMLKEHLILTLTATILATFLGVALGLYIARNEKLAGPILGLAGILQTIPSLAMLAFMIPLLGTGILPAITALFLYALLPIVRNTYTGITSVSADLKDAGTGMGMTPSQLLWQLELPLATRTIMAGIRTALVISVGTATLGAFIGAGGFGDPINTGLQQDDKALILWGAIPAAVLALSCDGLMAWLEKRIGPKGVE